MIATAFACWALLTAAARPSADAPASPGKTALAAGPAEGRLSGASAEERLVAPPGVPEDQARWRSGYEVNERLAIELSVSSRLQWTGKTRQYGERLEALAAKKDDPDAGRAGELLARYRKVQMENWRFATIPWVVDKTRACQYPMLHLEGAMRPGGAPRRAIVLAAAREDLDDCIGKARPIAERLGGLNEQLRGLQAAAEALLPAPPAAAVAPPTPVTGREPSPSR